MMRIKMAVVTSAMLRGSLMLLLILEVEKQLSDQLLQYRQGCLRNRS